MPNLIIDLLLRETANSSRRSVPKRTQTRYPHSMVSVCWRLLHTHPEQTTDSRLPAIQTCSQSCHRQKWINYSQVSKEFTIKLEADVVTRSSKYVALLCRQITPATRYVVLLFLPSTVFTVVLRFHLKVQFYNPVTEGVCFGGNNLMYRFQIPSGLPASPTLTDGFLQPLQQAAGIVPWNRPQTPHQF